MAALLQLEDVRKTVELLTHQNLPGRNGELADQLGSIRNAADPYRLRVKHTVGLLDPLAPFTFKVLPREYAGARPWSVRMSKDSARNQLEAARTCWLTN